MSCLVTGFVGTTRAITANIEASVLCLFGNTRSFLVEEFPRDWAYHKISIFLMLIHSRNYQRTSMGRLIEASSEYFTRGNKCPINSAGCQSVQNVGQRAKNNNNNNMDLNISLYWIILLKFNATYSLLLQKSVWNDVFQQFCLRWKFIRGKRCTMKGIRSVVTRTQLLLAADMQHGVVRALSSVFDKWLFVTRRSPNKTNNWLRSYVIKQTKVTIQCRKIKLNTSIYKPVTNVF